MQGIKKVLKSETKNKKWDRLILESVSGIKKCDRGYYKVRQVLSSVTVITKWEETGHINGN